MTARPWRDEYERMLVDEALRRMRRQPPSDARTWTLASSMTRSERRLAAAFRALARIGDRLRRIIRP